MRPPQVRASSLPVRSGGLPPIPAASTEKRFFKSFGRCNDVLACPRLIASYAIPVRQYRSLPVGFLHCIPHGKPACHLLTVRSVTPARKGLPIRPCQPGESPSGIISCYTLLFNPKNLYFQHFS